MKKNKTAIGLLLDRSGSMSSIQEEVITGTNQYIQDQLAVPGEALIFMAQFDNEYEVLRDFTPLNSFVPLNSDTYRPRGFTAYYESMIKTIDRMGEYFASLSEDERPDKVLIVTVTDGMDNASKPEYTTSRLKEYISLQRSKYNWDFVFLGSNIELVQQSAKLGMSKGASLQYAATKEGTRDAFQNLSLSTSRYRTSNSATGSRGISDETFWQKTEDES